MPSNTSTSASMSPRWTLASAWVTERIGATIARVFITIRLSPVTSPTPPSTRTATASSSAVTF